MAEQQLAGMRVDYRTEGFDVDMLAPTWHEQLTAWLAEAEEAGVVEANAMVLATAGEDGRPSSRTVLCKGLDERGVVFYTNYTSAKSRDLRQTRYASATFPWYLQHRQVHVRGTVEMVSAAETRAYWSSRDRRVLDDGLAAVTQRFDEQPVPVPQHWGGWRIVPEEVEFWQGRTNRMHDRLRFVVNGHDRSWTVRRLAP
jgi:pyridoxamine 5'-phosphate oxidase